MMPTATIDLTEDPVSQPDWLTTIIEEVVNEVAKDFPKAVEPKRSRPAIIEIPDYNIYDDNFGKDCIPNVESQLGEMGALPDIGSFAFPAPIAAPVANGKENQPWESPMSTKYYSPTAQATSNASKQVSRYSYHGQVE